MSRYRVRDLAFNQKLGREFLFWEQKWKAKRPGRPKTVRDQHRMRLSNDHVADRLEQSCLLAREHGLEYVYPLLDIRFLSFVYSLPSHFKSRDGLGRYLAREALRGFIPEEIRSGSNKFGAAIPNVFFRLGLDADLMKNLIEDSRRANDYHYVDYDKLLWQLEKLMEQKRIPNLGFGPKVFISTLSLLILQKWKREGKMITGIKC